MFGKFINTMHILNVILWTVVMYKACIGDYGSVHAAASSVALAFSGVMIIVNTKER